MRPDTSWRSPNRHVGTLAEAAPDEVAARRGAGHAGDQIPAAEYRAEGFNVRASTRVESPGRGIVDHLHLHVVPWWNGDTNFIPVLATCVIPEALEATYRPTEGASRWLSATT